MTSYTIRRDPERGSLEIELPGRFPVIVTGEVLQQWIGRGDRVAGWPEERQAEALAVRYAQVHARPRC